jgi:hypothetical protein
VNSDRQVNDILKPVFNQLTAEERQYGYFQRDSAAAHKANATMVEIRKVFEDGIISRELWPQGSPDLRFCDFYLWGNLKVKVYKNRARNTEALRNEITRVIGSITMGQLEKMSQSYLCNARDVWNQKVDTFSTCYRAL